MSIQGAPLDFNSRVHPDSNSTTSSGSTRVRTQASLHCGLAGTLSPFTEILVFFLDEESRILKSLENDGIVT